MSKMNFSEKHRKNIENKGLTFTVKNKMFKLQKKCSVINLIKKQNHDFIEKRSKRED